jgi:hypothetical protein
MAMDIQR